MTKNKIIYGAIGWTLLVQKNKSNVIIFSDMHDTLPTCDNKINISKWLETKFKSSKILLEEIPREEKEEIEDLWENSPHTQELKELYINNSKLIYPIDIRLKLLPFSWELINNYDKNIKFKKYLKYIDDFFCLKSKYIIENLQIYNINEIINSKSGEHYIQIKKNYKKFLCKYKNYKNITIKQIYKNKKEILDQINNILDEIMEWYICTNIIINTTKPTILHTGLIHSEKVIEWLLKLYNYEIKNSYGINKINEINKEHNCVLLAEKTEELFGGYLD
jgi:hypothetical protein